MAVTRYLSSAAHSGMSAQLFATSQSQTFYVKKCLHQASDTKPSSHWDDGAEGEREGGLAKVYWVILVQVVEKGCPESKKGLGWERQFSF